MGRYATPLITVPPLPELAGGVEVLISEARLAHRASDDPNDVEEEQLMTVLVSFDPQPAQRGAARALAGSFVAAQSTFSQLPVGEDLAGWLNELLNSRVAASLCLVWALPATYSPGIAQQIESVIAGLRNRQNHHLQITVATAEKSSEWAACISIDGFVATKALSTDSTAVDVFNMLAALMAPGMNVCVDAEDLRVVFGNHEHPSRMVLGVWPEALDIFMPANNEDEPLMKYSKAVAFMPGHFLKSSSQQKLLRAIRGSVATNCELVMVAPYGLLAEPLLADRIIPISLIAAPMATRMCDGAQCVCQNSVATSA